tara:strand:+ start:27399 stop:28187 length:789 start_codon:yes stop_codon:yes gene_type:complete
MIRKPKKKTQPNIQQQRRRHHWKTRLTFITLLILFLGLSLTAYLKKNQIIQQYNRTVQSIIGWTASSGLVVDEIFISGRHHTSQKEILKAIGIKAGDPMLNFDISYAKNNLEKIGWVQQVTLQRRWPNTIYVHLIERSPMALWQHNKKIRVVDQSGKVLKGVSADRHPNLPVIIGMNAPKKLPKLLKNLMSVPGLFERTTSATWVGNRRWNLSLDKNVTLLLPEQDVEGALKRFQKYEKNHKISLNAFHKIDLRLKNRLIID